MNKNHLFELSAWFDDYVSRFLSGTADDNKNIMLKKEHTHRVRENALQIAKGFPLDEEDTALAEVIALFHDIGRFPQYRTYRTYRDSDSVNHAVLGARILIENKLLSKLQKEEQFRIVRAVALHNVFQLPQTMDKKDLLHAKIIRDADKLDIWRIFIEILNLPEKERPTAAGLGLPDLASYSPNVLHHLHSREMVKLSELKTINDFKLLQLAWIYDLNFIPSLRLAKERDIIGRLSETLPQEKEIQTAVYAVESYLNERLAGSR